MRDKQISFKEKTVSQSSNISEQPSTSNVHSAKPVPSEYPVKYPNSRLNCKLSEKEEIIKYMSSLPRYLQHPERGDGTQNKALSFGVLDWSLLEDWNHSNSRAISGASSSKTTSSFPASNESTSSCIDNRICSNRQRRASLSTLDFHRSSLSSRADCGKTSSQTSMAFSDSKLHARWVKSTGTQHRGVDQIGGYMDRDLHSVKKKSSDKEAISQYPFASVRKGARVSSIKSYDFLSSPEELKIQNISSSEKYSFGDSFLTSEQPRSDRGNPLACCPDVQSSRLQSTPAGTASSLDGNSLSKGSHSHKDYFSDLDHKTQHPLMLPQKELKSVQAGESAFDINDQLDEEIPLHPGIVDQLQTSNSTLGTGRNFMSAKRSASIDCTDVSYSPSGQNKVKKPEPEQDLSPIRSSSLSRDRTPRSQSFREGIGTRTSTFILPRSDSVKSDTPTHKDDSPRQVKTHFRNQFSPLRRMFSPLVKSKARNYLPSSAESLARHKHEAASLCQSLLQELSLGAEEGCKLSSKALSSSDGTTEKASGFSAPQSTNSDDSMLDKKLVSLSKHALLQIISKNGIPLFIFSSNDHRDAFAAMERKISINRKNTLYWKYTFHSIASVKKKSGWMKQGKKADRCWQISNVVGHMEASCLLPPHLARDGIPENPLMIEYVLSSVRSREASDEKPDLKCHVEDLLNGVNSCNELAAVIIKTHSEPVKSSVRQDDDKSNTVAAFTETSSCAKHSNHSASDVFKKEKQSSSNMKVILPSGVHGIPANDAGMPSRLIDRWRSGGSCDCGGWDEGCSLTILDSQGSKSKSSLSSSQASCDSDACEQVNLFLQGAPQDALALRFAAVREGLYSIDFDVPMSSLQAFSICIAILHSRKNTVTARMGTKTLLESLLATRDDRFQMPTRLQGTGSLKSIPDPPLSPVGRA
ncbi:hypothetical protein EJ110_NYTH00062 [Nymphaea thermarum]|nr:hypothetical protein EJ110_NYTH00062 [Nymphaea thermarum]